MAGERKSEESSLPSTCEVRGWICFGPGAHKNGQNYSPAMVDRIPGNFKRLEGHTIPQSTVEKFSGEKGSTERETKIGHEAAQTIANKLKKSQGFLSTGKIKNCTPVPGYPGYVQIDVDNIPTTTIGGEINAGRLPGGSVELLDRIPDPNDPAKTIEGPILTGIAHLGHELPAVRNWPPELRERAKPKAVFADGTPVPANKSIPSEWMAAMAEAERMSEEAEEEDRFAMFRSFSESFMPEDQAIAIAMDKAGKSKTHSEGTMPEKVEVNTPVPAIKMSAKGFAAFASTFADMPPDEGKKFAASCKKYSEGGKLEDIEKEHPGFSAKFSSYADAPTAESTPSVAPAAAPGGGTGAMPQETPMGAEAMMAACKKFAEDPAATPEQKMMAAMYSDMTKRMGAMEAEKEAEKKQTGEVQMAQFSAMVEERIKKIARKVPPVTINSLIRPTALAIGQKKTFAAGSSMTVELNDLFKPFESMKEDDRLATTEAKPVTGTDGKPVPINEAPVNDPSGLLTRWASRDGILDRENSTGAKHLRRRIVQG